jgi:hypothetical protein
VHGDGVTVALRGFVSDAERLAAACALVATLAASSPAPPSSGPYR